jgi:predicted ester cyclase
LRVAAKPPVALSVAEPVEGFDPDEFARAQLNHVWNRGDLACLPDYYTADFAFTGPTDRQSLGIDAYAKFVLSIRECFSDFQVQMDEVYWMGNVVTGFLTSERWSATATHTRDGLFGSPSGSVVQLWGITQQHIVDGKVIREWLLFNELDVMMQIACAH